MKNRAVLNSALKKRKEAERLYKKYQIEVEKIDLNGYCFGVSDSQISKKEDIKTIKLSNSTTPMSCY